MKITNQITDFKSKLNFIFCSTLSLILLTSCNEADTSSPKVESVAKNEVTLERCLASVSLPVGFSADNVARQERGSRQYMWSFKSKNEINNEAINFEFIEGIQLMVNCHSEIKTHIDDLKNSCSEVKRYAKGQYDIKTCQTKMAGDVNYSESSAVETGKSRRPFYGVIIQKKSEKVRLMITGKRGSEAEAEKIFDQLLPYLL